MKKLSLIIVYSDDVTDHLFAKTLDSLVSQKQKDFELVIVDCSKESKINVFLDEYKKIFNLKYVKYCDGDTFNALLIGVNNASYDYIHLIKEGTIFYPDFIKFESELINKYDNILAFHRNCRESEDVFNSRQVDYQFISSRNYMKNSKLFVEPPVYSNICFNRSVLKEIDLTSNCFKSILDWCLFYNLIVYHILLKNSFVVINSGYISNKLNEENLSNITYSTFEEWKCLFKQLHSLLKFNHSLNPHRIKNIFMKKQNELKKLLFDRSFACIRGLQLPCSMMTNYLFYFIYRKITSFFYEKKQLSNKTRFKILGIRFSFQIKHDSVSGTNQFDICQPSLKFNNEYFTIKNFPIRSSDYKFASHISSTKSVAVVIQGAIDKRDDFTLETCKIYKKIFNNGESIILSTWRSEDSHYLNQISSLGIHIVLSDEPTFQGRGNLNYQIVSTIAGLKKAKELNCEYVLKTRSDQRFYKADLTRDLLNLLNLFPIKGNFALKSRLVVLSFNSFKYRYYGVNDMFLFGHVDDAINYWNVPLDSTSFSFYEKIPKVVLFKKYCSETYVASNFLVNIGVKPVFTLKHTWEIYKDCFIFIDRNYLDFYWPKYSSLESRWRFFSHNMLEEISFNDWLHLYLSNDLSQVDEGVNFDMPNLDQKKAIYI